MNRRQGPVATVTGPAGTVKIYRTGGAFTLTYYVGRERRREKRATLADAKVRAKAILEQHREGAQHVRQLTVREVAVVDAAVESLRSISIPLSTACREYADAFGILAGKASVTDAARFYVAHLDAEAVRGAIERITVEDLVIKFIADLKTTGKSRRYHLDMQARLRKFGAAFRTDVARITTDDLDRWLRGMTKLGIRSKKNFRRAIVTLFAFARDKNHLPPNSKTAAEGMSRFSDRGGSIAIYTPEEFAILLANIDDKLLPLVALGGFAGLRTAEVSRLDWSDFTRRKGFIEITSAKSKTASHRNVPILPALEAWLQSCAKKSGSVVPWDDFRLANKYTEAVRNIVDASGNPRITTVPNGLRHSFCTYRLAQTQDAAKVSLEAGNSPTMLFRHYRALATPDDAAKWFSIRPSPPANVELVAA